MKEQLLSLQRRQKELIGDRLTWEDCILTINTWAERTYDLENMISSSSLLLIALEIFRKSGHSLEDIIEHAEETIRLAEIDEPS